jgi:hypothetical protein
MSIFFSFDNTLILLKTKIKKKNIYKKKIKKKLRGGIIKKKKIPDKYKISPCNWSKSQIVHRGIKII